MSFHLPTYHLPAMHWPHLRLPTWLEPQVLTGNPIHAKLRREARRAAVGTLAVAFAVALAFVAAMLSVKLPLGFAEPAPTPSGAATYRVPGLGTGEAVDPFAQAKRDAVQEELAPQF